jgi:hypothetical protein
MERCRKREADILESIMMICDGDVSQYNVIINSPVSLYESKLKDFSNKYKKHKKEEKKLTSMSRVAKAKK